MICENITDCGLKLLLPHGQCRQGARLYRENQKYLNKLLFVWTMPTSKLAKWWSWPDASFLTIRLLSAGLGEVLLGSLCISHLQSGYSRPVQCFHIPWSPLQYPQAVLPHTRIVNTLLLQQTGWKRNTCTYKIHNNVHTYSNQWKSSLIKEVTSLERHWNADGFVGRACSHWNDYAKDSI